jgi:threonine/homoserine/homoserine lactone efflux protein
MSQLMTAVIPLSLGAAVSPTLLTAVVLVLSAAVAPRARAWATVAGGAVAMLALTVAAPLVARAMHSVKPAVIDRADVVLGVLLLLLAGWNMFRSPNAAESAKKRAPVGGAGAKAHLAEYFGFGVVLIATDFSSTILYLAALKEIAYARIPPTEMLAILAIPFFAVLAPAVIPAALSSVAPRQSDRALKPLAAWMGGHSKVITVAISVVFGIYLLARGLPPLLH